MILWQMLYLHTVWSFKNANLIAKSSYAQLLIQSYFSFIKEYV